MTRTHELAPDEITLTAHGAAVMARTNDTAGDAQPQAEDEGPLPELSEEELEAIFGDDAEAYDFSIIASINSNNAAWRKLAELRGAVIASPPSVGRDHALKLIDQFDAWFENQDDRLNAMATARRAESP